MPGPSVTYQDTLTPEQRIDMSLTIKPPSSFLASAESVVESKKVAIGGVQWQAVAKTFVENGTTYLAYYLRGTKAGRWRRWINADFYICDGYLIRNNKSLSDELRVSSTADSYAEWGFDKFLSEEALGAGNFVRNDELRLSLTFSPGIDIFAEESKTLHTNVKLVVQGQSVFVNKEATIHSAAFERLFKERTGKEIVLQDTNLAGLLYFLRQIYPPHEKLNARTVKGVYQTAKTFAVDYLLEQCDDHILGSTELSPADKLALADELRNDKLFDRLVHSLDKPRFEQLAVNADLKVQLRSKAVERHFRQPPHSLHGQPLALKKVLFAQETMDDGLMACVIGNLTKREMAYLKRVEHKDKFTKETLIALFGKAHSLIP